MSECTGKIVFLAKQARTTEGNYNPCFPKWSCALDCV